MDRPAPAARAFWKGSTMTSLFSRGMAGTMSLALVATLGAPATARADDDTLRNLLLLGVAAVVVKSVIDQQQPNVRPAPVYATTSYDRAEVNNIQFLLKNAGYYAGPIDGIWGPQTRASATAWQRAYGFAADGTLEKAQIDLLNRTAFTPAPTVSASNGPITATTLPPRGLTPAASVLAADRIRDLQSDLQFLGYYDGNIDGAWGPQSQSALERFRLESGSRGVLTAPPGVTDLASAALSAREMEDTLAADLEASLARL
jgi:peptidoglycan hydrolase-like protein with peptidoglycan-binding domain